MAKEKTLAELLLSSELGVVFNVWVAQQRLVEVAASVVIAVRVLS